MKLICPGFTGGLTVVPPLETCELFWANFAFTTLFSSWKMVLQPKYKLYQYDICPPQKKTQQRTNNRTFYKYKKSERDFLVRAIRKIPYRLRNAACRPLHVLLQTFPCSYTPCIFFTDITKRSDKNTKICQLIGLVFDTIYKRRNPTTTTWPVASKMESKTNGKTYCAFHKHANSKVEKAPSQFRFSLPSIIITITSNEPCNTETPQTDRNPPITNHNPWPFEPVKVRFCFLRGPLRWLTTAKRSHQLAFELQNPHVCEKHSNK